MSTTVGSQALHGAEHAFGVDGAEPVVRRLGHPLNRLEFRDTGVDVHEVDLAELVSAERATSSGTRKSSTSVAGISTSHLKAMFKRSTGLPVHAYVVQRRLERAKALLVRGELSASQVALAAGLAHQSHMVRCMRRLLGVTPTSVGRRSHEQPGP